MSSHSTALPRVRVGVVVPEGDELLLVKHRKGDQRYWLLPGGGLDFGERMFDCAIREVREETGLQIGVDRLLYLSEAIAPDRSRHILNLYVLGRVLGGSLELPEDPAIEEVAFMPFDQLTGLTLFPAIAETLVGAWKRGFSDPIGLLAPPWL